MKEITSYKAHRKHTFIKALGVTALAFLIQASISGAEPFAYITNHLNNTVSVIDTDPNIIDTDKVVATISVGKGPNGVAVSPDGKKVYVTNTGFSSDNIGTVSIIDTTTISVIETVIVGGNPVGVAITPNGKKVYVTNGLGYVSVIDATTNNITAKLGVGACAGVAITPDGKKAFVAHPDGPISVIDTSTDKLIEIEVSGLSSYGLFGIVIAPDGTKVYGGRFVYLPSDVNVINISTNPYTYITNIPVGNQTRGIALTPDGKKLYIANILDSTVSVIDTITNTVTATIPVGGNPNGVSITPDGKKVYVANMYSNTVSVIDTATDTVKASVLVGSQPMAFGQFIVPPESSQPILPVIPGYTNSPTDPNHDGRYEDVNGNGMMDFDDVVAYYDNMDWIGENVQIASFDYNNNSLIDFDDVVKLYDML